jgi:hypothetical protein
MLGGMRTIDIDQPMPLSPMIGWLERFFPVKIRAAAMPIVNATVSATFDEIADLLDIQGANPFRVRAYRNAARTVGELGTEVPAAVAKEEGVLVAINSDAHSTLQFDGLRFGVGQARRGWLEKSDVLNTRPLRELRELLARG